MRIRLDEMVRELDISREPYVRATVVWARPPASGRPGDIAIVRSDGTVHGWVGGACAEPVVRREATEALESGVARLIFMGPEGESGRPEIRTVPMSCASEGALEIFMEPIIPKPHVVLVGRSPAVEKLARLLDVMEWNVSIIDEEGKGGDLLTEFNVLSQFADADPLRPEAIVIATQGHYDEDALVWAMTTDASYIGVVTSQRRGAALQTYLRDLPAPDEEIARIRIRAGLDLGDIDHEEIGVSLLAELVAERASGALRPGDSPTKAQQEPATAVDPVCGMTVDIEGARFTHEHLGETVYFCCPACRKLFVDDPGAFASV